MKVRLLLAYKGSHFFGWQRQVKLRSVQAEVEKALFKIFKQKINVIASGRTDTGVHALGQTAHFEIEENLLENKNLKKALNAIFPVDLSVVNCWRAPEDFHARKSAVKKTYLYFIFTGESSPVLFPDLIWWRRESLNLQKLKELSQAFIGTKDFKSFQNSGSTVKSTVRRVYSSCWYQLSPFVYYYKITGSGFLKQMVRNIVGTSLELLKSQRALQNLEHIFLSKERKQAFLTAPSRGLYLEKVFYPPSLDKACFLL
ncbi:MAG: tRNA pseudouridine(38-40) synthase TruA [Bdellovibrionales bacterium]|nr:tRNA pseudouridine(38-40) synthase TruA [Bdellovibrionales bacterium]